MKALTRSNIINLGEPGHPMNGSVFIASTSWPLAGKMRNTNFPAVAIARLDSLPETDIAWFNSGRHLSRLDRYRSHSSRAPAVP